MFNDYFTYYDLLAEKAKVIVPIPVAQTVPNHFLWCSTEGFPPIHLSFLKNTTSLADRIGMVTIKVDEEGIYSCLAKNKAGFDSKKFPVTFVGASFIYFLLYLRTNSRQYITLK